MRKMTKSIRVAKDYDVKIQYRNEEWYISLEDLKINGVTLKDHVDQLNSLQAAHDKLLVDYLANVDKVAKSLESLELDNKRLEQKVDKLQAGLEKIIRGVITR